MTRLFICALVAAWPLTAAAADDPAKTPDEALKALKKEYQAKQQEVVKQYTASKDEAEKEKLLEEYYALGGEFGDRFIKIAEAHPKDPAAAEALLFVTMNPGRGEKAEAVVAKALVMLAKSDVEEGKLIKALPRLEQTKSPIIGASLRDVYTGAKSPELRAAAGLSLAFNLRGQAEAAYPKNVDKLFKEAETILSEVADKAAPASAARAKDALFLLNNLSIGKTAPEIDGEDLDGKTFKLSDYRGKVVVLDFWGHW
jgi:cytochrome oxidase Cu insertion factor (SCO1/SenC/PrrC family)